MVFFGFEWYWITENFFFPPILLFFSPKIRQVIYGSEYTLSLSLSLSLSYAHAPRSLTHAQWLVGCTTSKKSFFSDLKLRKVKEGRIENIHYADDDYLKTSSKWNSKFSDEKIKCESKTFLAPDKGLLKNKNH